MKDDVVDGHARRVEGTHNRRRQSVATADRCAKAPAVVADLDRAFDKWLECPDGSWIGRVEGHLEACPSDPGLELGGRSGGDHPAVVDDHDPVGKFVGLVEVLGGEQKCDAVGDELADDAPHAHPARRVEPGGRLVEEEHRWVGHQPCSKVQAPAHPA